MPFIYQGILAGTVRGTTRHPCLDLSVFLYSAHGARGCLWGTVYRVQVIPCVSPKPQHRKCHIRVFPSFNVASVSSRDGEPGVVEHCCNPRTQWQRQESDEFKASLCGVLAQPQGLDLMGTAKG